MPEEADIFIFPSRELHVSPLLDFSPDIFRIRRINAMRAPGVEGKRQMRARNRPGVASLAVSHANLFLIDEIAAAPSGV